MLDKGHKATWAGVDRGVGGGGTGDHGRRRELHTHMPGEKLPGWSDYVIVSTECVCCSL